MQLRTIKNKNMKWWVGIISCMALFLFIIFFSYEKMGFIWKGVKIEATLEQKVDSSIAEIKGVASKATYISINGREIFINKEGEFKESIALLPGFSIVTINAKDKFGKTAEKQFEIVKEESAPAVAVID